MTTTVAVVGAGRMGSVIARQLPEETKKIIIDTNSESARRLAGEVGGCYSDRLSDTRNADMAALVLPAPAINETIARLVKIVRKGCLILNMATTAHVAPELLKENRDVFIIDARIIGHAMSISNGEPGIVVVSCENDEKIKKICEQLPGFSQVVQGNANLVEKINSIGSTEGLRAALIVREKLRAMDIPEPWIEVALRTVCAGTIRSFVENDLGHFAKELVRSLEKKMAGERRK